MSRGVPKAFEQRERFQLEHRLRRQDGEYRWVVTAGVPRINANGLFVGFIGTSVDVSERKLAEAVLASRKLIEAQEEERTRIARELHDDISQRITVLSIQVGVLKQSLPASPTISSRKLGKCTDRLEICGRGSDAVAHSAFPEARPHRAESGRGQVLSRVINRHDVKIDVHFENIPEALPAEISLCLYRVFQEALQNVLKHGVPRRADVSLSGHIETVHLTVKDSGPGFDPHEAMRGPGLGLTSMKERLKSWADIFPSTRNGGTAQRFTLSRR